MITRRDVVFNEADFRLSAETEVNAKDVVELEPSSERVESHNPEEPRHSVRQRRPPVRYGRDEYVQTAVENHVDHLAYNMYEVVEPANMEALLQTQSIARFWKMRPGTS